MGTRTSESDRPRIKILDLSRPTPDPPIRYKTLDLSAKPTKHRSKRKVSFVEPAFKRIRYFEQETTDKLDKLRNDLLDSIQRTVRVEQAFVKELTRHAHRCNRIKSIIKSVGEVPFHCDLQRQIVSEHITHILESKDVEAKRLREEAAKKRREDLRESLFPSYLDSE
jgi:hypothetical protein